MDNLLSKLEKSKLPYLSTAFAKFLNEQESTLNPVVLLAAAFVNYELSRGKVYLDLSAFFNNKEEVFNEIDIKPFKSYFVKDWESKFSDSQIIKAENSPLVWDKTHNHLYLRRYWTYQKTVDDMIADRLAPIRTKLPAEITAQLDKLFLPGKGKIAQKPDWQKIACAVALRSKFSIITGGPGTGKTTTLTKLLILLVSLMRLEEKDNDFKPKILLAAPTGKAANRVSESINDRLDKLIIAPEIKALIPTKASTIHRLLGSSATSRLKKHNRHNPLIADIVIVDEASMIDLEMMAALLDALPKETQLILLGDKDQLSSVEPGYVFGNLCKGADKDAYNEETLAWISDYAKEKITNDTDEISAINQQTVMLKYSHRFLPESGIGQLANSVNSADKDTMLDTDDIFENHKKDLHKITNPKDLEKVSKENYAHYKNEIKNRANYSNNDDGWAVKVLEAFDKFRILCAIHESDLGTDAINNKVQNWLFPNNEKNIWFEGRPVMITKNDYSLGLMNGDIGIALKKEDNLKVAFLNNDDNPEKIRWFSTSRISDVQTAFALTVHKSQGSEFNHTLFVLPSPEVSVLSKELVYTAITRAISHFTLFDLKTSQGETMKNNNPTNENTAVSNDAWLDELLAWAYKNDISKEQLPSDKEDILNLTELDLSDNQLSTLPESFGNLTNLTYLDLSYNQLSTLPESFGNLTKLTELHLSDNQFSTLPESIGNLTNLTKLDLSDNQFSTLPKLFGKLPNLNHLDLSNNAIDEIDEDEIYSSVAKALRYYENNLRYFDVGFKIPPAKTTLVWYETYTKTREFSTELTEEEAELFETDKERFFREVKYTYNQNLEWERVVEDRTHDFELK